MRMWKRLVSLVLTSALVLGLCACNTDGAGGGIGGKKENSANAALAKEYVYRLDEFDFSTLQEGSADCSIMQVTQTDDRIYVVLRSYGQDYSTSSYKLASMNKDGSDTQIYELQTSVASGQESGNGAASGENVAAETEGTDSEAAVSETGKTEEAASDNAAVDNDMSLGEEYSMIYEDISFGSFQIADGYLYANKNYYFEDYRDQENIVSIHENYVCRWDLEGKMQQEILVDTLSDENAWYYINNLAVMDDGRVMLLVGGDQNGKIVVDPDGTVYDIQPVEALNTFFEQSSYSAIMPDGKMLLSYYNQDWTKMSVCTYDFKTDEMTEPFELPATMSYNGLSNLSVDANGDLLFSTSQGVFKYHIGDAEAQQMMSFVNSDLNVSYLDAILSMDEEHFVGLYSVYDDRTYARTLEGGIFTKVNPEDIPDKEVLILGGAYIASDLKERVVDFNKSSNTHRIVLKDYSQYNTNEDYNAGYTQLNNDIIAGNMPDILVVDSYNMSLENYVSKGLLADIGALIANDEELSQIDYMDNVFEACKVDGKLYEVIPSFSVNTYIGKTSLVGSHRSWTMEDAQALLAKMPEGTSLFGDMTRDGYFRTVMELCGRDFIDVYSGKCNFDSEEFISLMEFAKTLPKEFSDDYYGEDWYMNYESQYRDERTILSNCYITGIQYLVYTINGSFGEEVSFIGMPTSGGQGSAITTSTSYAISAKSAYGDVAWQFLKYYLTNEYQDTIDWQLPVSEFHFDKVAHKATEKPVYYDNLGNKIEEEYSYWINDENIILDPFTPAQVKSIKNFIGNVNTRSYNNEDIMNIITEEMEAFYLGDKSAADVAAIIQSRAQLFVNENR